MACKSLSRSLNKLLFVPLFLHETFSLCQEHSKWLNHIMVGSHHVCDPTIYYRKQNKRKLKAKVKMLQEKRIVHEAIKI
jgi:hypothetical protein